MTDREKVIMWLSKCAGEGSGDCRGCPYDYTVYDEGKRLCIDRLMLDALALLKEQEPVEPEVRQAPAGMYAVCGNCKYNLMMLMNGRGPQVNHLPKFCPECGRKVMWE